MLFAVKDLNVDATKVKIYRRLAHLVPSSTLECAIGSARRIEDPLARAIVVARLANRMEGNIAEPLCDESLGALSMVLTPRAKAQGIGMLARILPHWRTRDLLSLLEEVDSPEARVAGLASLVNLLAPEDRAMALDVLSLIPDADLKALAITELASDLPHECMTMVFALIANLPTGTLRAMALKAVLPNLTIAEQELSLVSDWLHQARHCASGLGSFFGPSSTSQRATEGS